MQERAHRIKNIITFFIFISLLQCVWYSTTEQTTAQESALLIDVSSSIITSGTNFTVSVYDPSIDQGTPYQVNVTILFNKRYYQITPDNENSEIQINAPMVTINRTYLIEAYTKEKTGNTTILVTPSIETLASTLAITIDTYTIAAYETFTVLITDRNGNPINNVSVGLQQGNEITDTILTDEQGQVSFICPNAEYITIIAEKQGYSTIDETIMIQVKDTYNQFLSHPLTPIILSFLILLSVILYVSIICPYIHKKKTATKNNPDQHSPNLLERYKKNRTERNTTPQIIPYSHSPLSTKKTIHHADDIKKHPFTWFATTGQTSNNAHLPDNQTELTRSLGIDDIHKQIDTLLTKKEKEKQIQTS